MIILHASWLDRRLHLWGERSVSASGAVRPRRGRPSASVQARPLPFGVVGDGLEAAIAFGPPRWVRTGPAPRAAWAWLPTVAGQAVPSSPLIGPAPEEGTAALLPWQIAALPMVGTWAEDLLARAAERELLEHGLLAGADLRAWAALSGFARELAARQECLPGCESTPNGWAARWHPLLAGEDGERLEALARALPPSATCLTEKGCAQAPAGRSGEAAKAFLTAVLDARMRQLLPAAGGGPVDSVHDAWLQALRGDSPLIRWKDAQALSLFADQLARWQRPLRLETQTGLRLCFRLEEPEPSPRARRRTTAPWRLRYLVQPLEDRSLLVPVEETWKSRDLAFKALGKNPGEVREWLLAALGQAAALCPGVAASLERREPGEAELDNAGAHRFLTEFAPALRASGFGLLLPAWWTGRGARPALTLRAKVKSPKMTGAGGLTLAALAQVNWTVMMGGRPLSAGDLAALAEYKSPLVRFRGEWMELDPAMIREAAALLGRRGTESLAAGEVLRMALSGRRGERGAVVEEVEADGWIGEMMGRLRGEGRYRPEEPPNGFDGALRPYQERGYSWLAFLRQWGLGACLADDMGLGKTIQTLALLQRERERGEKRPVLLVCPTSVVQNWVREAARFTPALKALVHHGTERGRAAAFARSARTHALVVTSYGLLHRDLDAIRKVRWAGVVLDEAHNIKNPETRQSKAARSVPSDYRIALTGTPVENHVGDLWALMEFLNPGLLGTQTAFRRDFYLPIQAEKDAGAAGRLKAMTGPFILRRLKTDPSVISDLPPKVEMKEYCTLTREQAGLYAAVLKEAEEALEEAEGISRRGLILATLSKLKQVCNHPAQFLKDHSPLDGRSGKLARLTDLLGEAMEEGDRALVFTQFAEMGELLRAHLQDAFGREMLFLHGGTPRVQRDRMVERFQTDPDAPPVFILSLKAGGTGLNLTRANHVFHFDRWWNPSVENQATDRAFRIGQRRRVQVRKFVCAGTLEERIDDMIEKKLAVAGQVIGAGEAWLTELSDRDLKAVFALGRTAVEE